MPDAPTYRFWGRKPPVDGTRTPLMSAEADVEDGVATMRLYDPIDSWGGEWGVSAKEFAGVLDKIPDDVSEIRLHVNSPGGEVFDGIAIMNALRSHPARVSAVVDGIAASAASFIAVAADETVMGPNSELMIHDAFGLALGNAAVMHKMGDVLDHLSDNIASVYAKKSAGDVDFWRDAMRAETWYSADEAVAAGLADAVRETDEQPKDRFDLKALFDHEGRQDAPAPPIPSASARTSPSRLMLARHRMNERKPR